MSGGGGLADLILTQVRARPDAVAVCDDQGVLTYHELGERAHRIAGQLRELGAGPGRVVGVCAERSRDMVAAIVGILLARGVYLPLEPHLPVERLGHMLAKARPIAVLADAGCAPLARAAGAERIVDLAAAGAGAAGHISVGASNAEPAGEELAYLLFTSGSTGQPKGVAVPHAGPVNTLLHIGADIAFGADDVIVWKAPSSFDMSIFEVFLPLLAGARLVVAKPHGDKDPVYLADLVRRESVTTMVFVPSMLRHVVSEMELRPCPSLRRVIVGGEALPGTLANRFAAVSDAPLYNVYGPTETAMIVSVWRCRRPEPEGTVPIGHLISGVRAYVRDPAGALVATGEAGELYLGGVCVARGYLGREDLTAAAFGPDPFTDDPRARLYRTGDLVRWSPAGCLEFIGRVDHQVKLRGFRIECGEIEAALLNHPAVGEAAVVLREDAGPVPKLVGYLVPRQAALPDDDSLRAHLARYLPDYMIPSIFVEMAAFPQTSTGKCDRAALPAPAPRHRRRATGRAPSRTDQVAVMYGQGSASPTDIAAAATSLVQPVFVIDSTDEHSARMLELLGELGPTIDVAGEPLDAGPSTAAAKLGAACGIVTFSEALLRATAYLADQLGLPFHDVATVGRLTDKHLQRQCLNAAGVSPTRHAVAASGTDIRAALREIGLPAVVKPRIGQSSVDAFWCETPEDCEEVVRAVSTGPSPRSGWVVEEYLTAGRHPAASWLADYCAVESAVAGDRIWHFSVTDKLPLAPPFRETGAVLPSLLPDDVRQAVCATAEAAIRALGITSGLVHTEVKLTPGGPRVIEVNGRLGGDVARLLRRATGFDPVRLALEIAARGRFDPPPVRYTRAVFHYSVVPPQRPVRVRKLAAPSVFRSAPGVWAVERPAREGHVLDWRRGSREVAFRVWAEASTSDEIPAVLRELDSRAAQCVEYDHI